MSLDTLLYNLDLSKRIRDYITGCLKENAFDASQEACVVRIFCGNPFRISDNNYHIDIRDPSVIISKLKAVNRNINWNTMPGTIIRLKKWRIISDYDEDHDRLKFDIIVDDADYLEKTELSHQDNAEIKSILESPDFKNKFQVLKKHFIAERFDMEHPIDDAIALLGLGKTARDLEEVTEIKPFISSMNKFPSTFSVANQDYAEEDYSASPSPNKHEMKKSITKTLQYEDQDNVKLGEYLLELDGESARKDTRKESIKKKNEYIKKLQAHVEAMSRSQKPTPLKSSPIKSKPTGVMRVSDAQFREVMRAGPKSILNKRTPQPEDLEEVYFDASANEEEEQDLEVEEDQSDYMKSFKLIKAYQAYQQREKPRSLKKSPVKSATMELKSSKIFQRFQEHEDVMDYEYTPAKSQIIGKVANPLNKKVKINLKEYKPVHWKLTASSGFS